MLYDHYLIGCHERSTYGRACLRPTDGGSLRRPRLCPKAGRKAMSYENIVGLALSAVLAVYLAAALLFPERF
ncbi:MAG TPA: K(+)-transporting ATPase subunit F [Mycobacterium sp.]|nr:K(+)-transporting ATPase subunit F [Mycobacterium sp.]